MPTLNVSGNFVSGFQLFLDYLPDSQATFPYIDRLSFTDTIYDPVAVFGAGFNGDFDWLHSGPIDTISADITYFDPKLEELRFEFSDLSRNLESIFTFTGDQFTYSIFSIVSALSGRPYSVIGSRGGDIIGGSLFFQFSKDDTFAPGFGDDLVRAGRGADRVFAGAGNDRLLGEAGTDRLFGQDGNDFLLGGADADHLDGGEGNDDLKGGAGNDILIGGAGDDRLSGGGQADRMTGGAGRDVFLFGTGGITDRVTDFEIGADRIEARRATGFDDLTITTRKAGTFVSDGKQSLFLPGIDGADLGAGDFIF